MDMERIVVRMLVLLLLILTGFAARRKGLLDGEVNNRLSALLLNISIPAMIIASVAEGSPFDSLAQLGLVLLVFFAVNLAAPLAAEAAVRLLRIRRDRDLFRFMFALTNSAFLGFPVLEAVLGEGSLIYGALFLLPNNLLMFLYGEPLFRQERGFYWKELLRPPVAASLLACLLCVLNVRLPEAIALTGEYLGNITTPLAMMMVGSSLAEMRPKELFSDRRLLLFLPIKMLVLPVLFWGALALTAPSALLVQVGTLMMAMPVASNAVIFCNLYRGNAPLAGKAVFLTSMLSLATIPLLCWLLF